MTKVRPLSNEVYYRVPWVVVRPSGQCGKSPLRLELIGYASAACLTYRMQISFSNAKAYTAVPRVEVTCNIEVSDRPQSKDMDDEHRRYLKR